MKTEWSLNCFLNPITCQTCLNLHTVGSKIRKLTKRIPVPLMFCHFLMLLQISLKVSKMRSPRTKVTKEERINAAWISLEQAIFPDLPHCHSVALFERSADGTAGLLWCHDHMVMIPEISVLLSPNASVIGKSDSRNKGQLTTAVLLIGCKWMNRRPGSTTQVFRR